MFDGAKTVFSIASAIAAVLLILWVIGVMTSKGSHGMNAVGAGISEVFSAAGGLIGSIHF